MRWRIAIALCVAASCAFGDSTMAQKSRVEGAAAAGELTVARIYSQPSLSGQLARGLQWSPDGKLLTFFEVRGAGKDAQTELWSMDASSVARRLFVAAEKLLSILPAAPAKANQPTGLGLIAPSQYQWAPDSSALLFQSEQSLTWFDLKTQTSRTLVSGQSALADPKILPDVRSVSFVRDHNVWVVDVASGKERA